MHPMKGERKMGEYVYLENENERIRENLIRANREIQKLHAESKKLDRKMDRLMNDLDGISNGWLPSDKFEPTTIHGVEPQDWFFDPVHVGDCHDCPLQSVDHQAKYQNRCGAEKCIIRQLCELQGLTSRS